MASSSLLWALIPPEGKPSWLFGTMHIRDERAYQLSNPLYHLIEQADAFIGEMDLKDPLIVLDQASYDPKKFITEKPYQKLRQQLLKSFQVDIDFYAHLHPLMIMSVLSSNVLQSEHHISLDEHLWNYAKECGKDLYGLESYETQFTILHGIDPKPLYRQIQRIGRSPQSIRRNTDKGLTLYLDGNIHALYMLSKTGMHDLRKKIIFRRNEKMVEVIRRLDTSQSFFIAVGAGHLSGNTGILSGLKKAGWKVKNASKQLLEK